MKKLTKSQMRVTIAKDALAQLRLEKYVATKGTYIDQNLLNTLNFKYKETYEDKQAQPELENLKECRVCAKGAIYLSTVRKFNDATICNFSTQAEIKATSIFGENNLTKIESAFEEWTSQDTKGNDTNSKLNK